MKPASMLFTRCPGCQTTFRISADTLRVANGAVRCGTCATVFSAFSGLQQGALEEDLQSDDEFLSPTMQTRELAGIEEIDSPDVGEESTELDDGAAAVGAESGPDAAPSDAPEVDEQARAEEDSSPETVVFEPSLEFDEEPAPQPVATDGALGGDAEAAASDSSAELQFEAPADEWTMLLSEIERVAEGGTEEEESSDVEERAEDEDSADAVDYWHVGDPAEADSWTEIELPGDADTANELVAVGAPAAASESSEPVDLDIGELEPEAGVAELLEVEPDISAEQVDATLSAEPDRDLLAVLERSISGRHLPGKSARLWTSGSAVLLTLLVFQVVHHFRAALADQPVVGPLVQGAYGVFGTELVPNWNIDQYEILNWVATEAGAGNLRITAQIRNNGPRAQPYPHVHLELKDRWEAVVGSRVFGPVEYLEGEMESGNLMTAGTTVPADLAVVDPGNDAYGFELDVCLETGAGSLSCASERVFQ